MRDPERIPEVLAAIEAVWSRKPDLRLGQVLNLACLSVVPGESQIGAFVLWEEDQLIEGLRALEQSAWVQDRPAET